MTEVTAGIAREGGNFQLVSGLGHEGHKGYVT